MRVRRGAGVSTNTHDLLIFDRGGSCEDEQPGTESSAGAMHADAEARKTYDSHVMK